MPAKPNHTAVKQLRRKYEYIKILEQIERNTGRSMLSVFCSFARLSACALSLGQREEEYLQEAKRWKKEELYLFSKAMANLIMEAEQFPYTDIMGGFYISLKYKGNGEFYTPDSICNMMGAMALSNPKPKPTRVAEPCCGAGQMILGLAKQYFEAKVPLEFIIVEAQDIDATACDLCYINTTLWGVPTIVRHGNSLVPDGEWAAYPNIHYYRAVEFWKSWKILEAMKTTERASKSKLNELRERRRPKLPKKMGQLSLFEYIMR